MRIRERFSLKLGRNSKKDDEIPNISERAFPLKAFTNLLIGFRRPHVQPGEPGSGVPSLRESSKSYLDRTVRYWNFIESNLTVMFGLRGPAGPSSTLQRTLIHTSSALRRSVIRRLFDVVHRKIFDGNFSYRVQAESQLIFKRFG
jgi:hypothetical protein